MKENQECTCGDYCHFVLFFAGGSVHLHGRSVRDFRDPVLSFLRLPLSQQG